MIRRVATALLVAAVLTGGGVVTSARAANLSSSQLLSLEGQFFCVSCHQPLNQVYSAEAQAEKNTLAQLVDQGLPLSQVKQQMVADYGPQVLANPSNPWIYIVPIIAVLLGLGVIAYLLPRWLARRGTSRVAAVVAGGATTTLTDAEQARLNRELDAF